MLRQPYSRLMPSPAKLLMHRPTFTNFSTDGKLPSASVFLQKWAINVIAAILFLLLSLFAGMVGYHLTEQMPWIDAFVNASMILSGMGPMGELKNESGKLFAGVYALYSGVAFIFTTGLILAPVAHRLLHRFHVDEEDEK